eukprot:TRINITY_DN17121_c0_g1_i1.p1 TRINITY_DN17121_c0_g1~~TRINITY_DN17121_c0_g1_i1.p1  ORF type:complete len:514 (+),score=95.45 TRINITY_DN17121_c0_g1_i1:60-1601(+)
MWRSTTEACALVIACLLCAISRASGEGAEAGGYEQQFAARYAYIAAAAYCDATSILGWNCTACKHVDRFRAVGAAFDPATHTFGFVGLDSKYLQLVLAFRGRDPENVVSDVKDLLVVGKTHWRGTGVGVRFLEAEQALEAQLMPFLAVLLNAPGIKDWSITLTGHSIGGAVATVAALSIFSDYGQRTTLITYGAPRVGDASFARKLESTIAVRWRITHGTDVVVHLPESTAGFVHHGPEIWYPLSDYSGGLHVVCTGSENATCANGATLSLPADHLSYLGIPVSSLCCRHAAVCHAGYWAACCEQRCPADMHCYGDGCDHDTGTCRPGSYDNMCETGWWGWTEDEALLLCNRDCPADRHCFYDGCYSYTGECYQDGYDSYNCEAGWWGWDGEDEALLCHLPCPATSHCFYDGCDSRTGACYEGNYDSYNCETGWWGWNGDTLSCDKECAGNCHCFYDGCSSVSGECYEGTHDEYNCRQGWWGWDTIGPICDTPCPAVCKSGCNSKTGVCNTKF